MTDESNESFARRLRTKRRSRSRGWHLWECVVWQRQKHRLVYVYLLFPGGTSWKVARREAHRAVYNGNPPESTIYELQHLHLAARVVERHFAESIEDSVRREAWGVLSWEDNAPLYVGADDETAVPVAEWKVSREA